MAQCSLRTASLQPHYDLGDRRGMLRPWCNGCNDRSRLKPSSLTPPVLLSHCDTSFLCEGHDGLTTLSMHGNVLASIARVRGHWR